MYKRACRVAGPFAIHLTSSSAIWMALVAAGGQRPPPTFSIERHFPRIIRICCEKLPLATNGIKLAFLSSFVAVLLRMTTLNLLPLILQQSLFTVCLAAVQSVWHFGMDITSGKPILRYRLVLPLFRDFLELPWKIWSYTPIDRDSVNHNLPHNETLAPDWTA